MGSKIYDFLCDSFLFDNSLICDEFRSIPADDVWGELQRYREFCLSAEPELEGEILLNNSSLKLFSGIRQISIALLKQSAFYVQQHILYDPLFALTRAPNELSGALNKLLGTNDSSLDKVGLAGTLRYLKELTPMVVADYVKFLPTSYVFEPPDQLPLTYSDKGFTERIPASLHDFMHQHAIIESGKRVDNHVLFDGSFGTGRIIAVRFKDHGFEDIHGYTLTPSEVIEADRDGKTVHLRMTLPDTPPDRATFDAWVYQSINQAAGDVYHRVFLENMFSAKFGALYLTNSRFIFDLLTQIVPVDNSIQANTANALLRMTISFLDGIDSEALMRVRSQDGQAFESFRLELDKQLRELRHIEDPDVLRVRTENVVHELAEVQIRQIDQKIRSLRKKFFSEAVIVGASLCSAVQSGGLTFPVALLAAFQGYKSVTEYRKHTIENPAFFLWRVLKDSRKA